MSGIGNPDLLARLRMTTLTFEELARLDGEELGSANNPYAVIGLTISKAVVKAAANLNSASRGVALKSKAASETGQHEIEVGFAKPQRGFGVFYRAPRATSITVKTLDGQGTVLEEAAFPGGEGYAGVIRARAEIERGRIVASMETFEAQSAGFYIDDFSFGRELKS